jgi:hypothetical protein
MFSFVVKRLGFLKDIPLLAIFYDSLLKLWYFATKPQLLVMIDEIEDTFLVQKSTTVSLHKYGGSQFNYLDKEIAHLHSNGLLDVLFSKQIKNELKLDGRITDYHVFKNSGWISFYITNEDDMSYAKVLLKIAYQREVSADM